MADLKLCPFCGRIPVVEDCGTNRYFVRCKCGIAQDKLFFQKCDAVRAWNKRKEVRVKDANVPITDTISRQAAIDALGDEPEVWTGKDEYAQGLNNQWHYDRNAIKAVPSAEPQWIPCSERLPDKPIQVLVYAMNSHFSIAQYREMRTATSEYEMAWVTSSAYDNPDKITNVIAWMPLPEPYKEEQE